MTILYFYIIFASMEPQEQKKCEEIFILMNLAKMTLTEINTLTENERMYLSKSFMQQFEAEQKAIKRDYNNKQRH